MIIEPKLMYGDSIHMIHRQRRNEARDYSDLWSLSQMLLKNIYICFEKLPCMYMHP